MVDIGQVSIPFAFVISVPGIPRTPYFRYRRRAERASIGVDVKTHLRNQCRRFDLPVQRGRAVENIVQGHQGTSLDALLEAAILEKVERAAEAHEEAFGE